MFRFKSHILWIILEGFWFKFSETPVKTLFLLTSLSGPSSRSGVFSPSGALGTTSQLFSRADPRRFRSAQIQQHEKIRSPQGHPDRPGPKLCREAGPCLNAAPLAVGRGGERARSAGEGALGPSSHGPPFPPVAGGFDFAFSIRFDVRTLLKAAKGNRCFCSEGGSERCWSFEGVKSACWLRPLHGTGLTVLGVRARAVFGNRGVCIWERKPSFRTGPGSGEPLQGKITQVLFHLR